MKDANDKANRRGRAVLRRFETLAGPIAMGSEAAGPGVHSADGSTNAKSGSGDDGIGGGSVKAPLRLLFDPELARIIETAAVRD